MATIDNILTERNQTHGDYREQAAFAQHFKRMMREGKNWPELDFYQAQSLEAFADKISRVLTGNFTEVDHWRDVAGYAQLVVRELEAFRGAAKAPAGVTMPPRDTDAPLNVPEFILRDMEAALADQPKPKGDA